MRNKQPIAEKRETAAVLLLIIVFLSILRPVSPYISDGIAHTFWSEQHHTAMHQNGINHVDEQLVKVNQSDENESAPAAASTINIESSMIYFVPVNDNLSFQHFVTLSFKEDLFQIILHSITPEIQPPDIIGNTLPLYA